MTEPTDSTNHRIVLVDDHLVVRAGLRRVLEEHAHLTVVGEAGTCRDALEQVEIKRPDIVVLDIDLPDGDGIELLPQLLAKARGCPVLMLSMHDDPAYVERAFAEGASGYLLKDAAVDDLVDAIDKLIAGQRYVHPTLGARLAQAVLDRADDPLTPRERDVVRLLALGHTNQEVASTLFLSVRTVESHRAQVMSKLRLSSRAELVRWALDDGLLDADRNAR